MNEIILAGLVDHFGKANALRIMACALIMAQSSDKARGDIEIAVRMTIGALKRIRRHGGYKLISWAMAIEKLEGEQDEGRHYGLGGKSSLMVEVARIERANDDSYVSIMHGVEQVIDTKAQAKQEVKDNEAMAVAMIHTMIQQEAIKYQEDQEAQIAAKEWVAQYWHNVSETKRKFLTVVMHDYCNVKGISEVNRDNLRKRYVPRGVKVDDFVEVLVKYVS